MASTQTFVALLRGINVGGANKVPMAALRALLESLGHTGVQTVLASGNAVFRARGGQPGAHARSIAAALNATLGIDVAVIVKSAADLAAIVQGNGLAGAAVDDDSKLLVAFAPDAGSLGGLAAVAAFVQPPERWLLGRDAAYLHCPHGIHCSRAASALLGKPGRAATTRNWATTLKLHALANAEAAPANVAAQRPTSRQAPRAARAASTPSRRAAIDLEGVRRFALALDGAIEAPHFQYTSFRVNGRIFATAPPEATHVHAFVDECTREQARALYPQAVDKLMWGGKVVGVRIDLARAGAEATLALVRAAWAHKGSAGRKPPKTPPQTRAQTTPKALPKTPRSAGRKAPPKAAARAGKASERSR